MGLIVFAARLFVGTLLLVSGAGKLANRSEFLEIAAAYKLLPKRALTAFSYGLPAAEIITGVMVLLGLFTPVPAYVACGLFLLFIFAMAVNLLRGANDTPCGCFAGRLEKISWLMVLRNVTLCSLALLSVGKAFTVALVMVAVFVLVKLFRSLNLAFASASTSHEL